MRSVHPTIRSVSKCQLCILKEQGVLNAEDYVLAQYRLPGPDKPPVPIDLDDSIASGVLLLYPEARIAEGDPIPQTGGIIGTIRSVFRTLGFAQPKPAKVEASREIASEKRSGIYGPAKGRRN